MSEDDEKKCPVEDICRALYDPKGFLKPGEKMGCASAYLAHRGGLSALFAPGISYEDFKEGRISKHLLIVEHDSDERNELLRTLKGTAFEIRAAANLEDALAITQDYDRHFQYALIGEMFPRARGAEPQALAAELYDRLVEHSPDITVLARGELDRPYVQVPRDAGVRQLCEQLVAEAEQPRDA